METRAIQTTSQGAKKEQSVLGKIGRASLKFLSVIGKKIDGFRREHPGATATAMASIDALNVIEDSAISSFGKLVGKEQELATGRQDLRMAFESVQREVASFYHRKCTEMGLSREEQVGGATTFGFVLSMNKVGRKFGSQGVSSTSAYK